MIKWFFEHPMTSFFSIFFPILSILFYYFNLKISNILISLIVIEKLEQIPFFIIFLLLLSGIEKSLGILYYSLWIFWSSFFLFIFRHFFLPFSTGPTFMIFCPFITFIIFHQPIYYFKFFNINFTDKFFYIIFLIQFIFLSPISYLIDFFGCLISNILFKYIIKITNFIENIY